MYINRFRRIWCWMRGYHVLDEQGVYPFRYDCSGICYDCGIVGNGIIGHGE